MRLGARPVMSVSFQHDPPGLRSQLAADLVDQAGLAGAVRADDDVAFAGATVESDTSSVTTRLPKAQLRCSMSRMFTAAPCPSQLLHAAPDAAGEEHHAADEDDADDGEPMLAVGADDVLHQQKHGGADRRPDQRAGAAQHGHDQNVAGRGPVHRVRRNEAVEDGVKPAGETGKGAGDGEGQELVGPCRIADRQPCAARSRGCRRRRGRAARRSGGAAPR